MSDEQPQFPASPHRELPEPFDVTTPLAVQLIDAALRDLVGTDRSTVSVEWFHNVLLDIRSAVTNSVVG